MKVTFDPRKRAWTLAQRSLDFADAEKVFAGPKVTVQDTRYDYPEPGGRFVTAGLLEGRLVIVVWTLMGEDWRHVISMRKANDREKARFGQRLE